VNASSYHEPVLVEEALAYWVTDPRGRYLDGTVGGGGHAEALLLRFPEAELIGLDRDPEALEASRRRLEPFGPRVRLIQANIADLVEVLETIGGTPVTGILFDLGVSSRQIDDPARGFSYLQPGPLRMTLDREAGWGAAEYLDEVGEDELVAILRDYGELPGARRAARAVLDARAAGRLATTTDLAAALRTGGVRSPRRLSQAFQALRLAVNDELGSLDRGLAAAARSLPPAGVLCVIAFESLSDRRVKHAFRPPRTDKPVAGVEDPPAVWEPITRRAVRPSAAEVSRNPRSRSARLRAARRTGHA
jgi:16S rRNA (cytosine1402-N4)-methyltransferase